jgi:hypothetical protein
LASGESYIGHATSTRTKIVADEGKRGGAQGETSWIKDPEMHREWIHLGKDETTNMEARCGASPPSMAKNTNFEVSIRPPVIWLSCIWR